MSRVSRDAKERKPVLSLILCSRNDEYMGNSRWRLETTLNYVSEQIEALGRAKDVEVLVTDWGSEVPLRDELRLNPATAGIVYFIHVPPEIAQSLQKDSPFPEVLALNAAARRARGRFIGRIDQDTLVGRRFLEAFFELYEEKRPIEIPLDSALLFSNVRMIPYRFAVRCPPLAAVGQFIERFGSNLKVELTSRKPFYWHSVGIWLLPRALWYECGGYDEEMLYMNSMEINMIERLLQKYKLINLGPITGCDFYHLEHYHPWVSRRSSVYRKNNSLGRTLFHPNNEEWGLAQYALRVDPYPSADGIAVCSKRAGCLRDKIGLVLLFLQLSIQGPCDILVLRLINAGKRWNSRRQKAWAAIKGKPMRRWFGSLSLHKRSRGA
jgi:hypothetical protein